MSVQGLFHHLFHPLQPEEQRAERTHFPELDSLRGLAAASVLLLHFDQGWLEAAPPHFVRYISSIPLLTNGHAAVILFFVLSGFVLTLPRMGATPQRYPVYVARRICRIYLPYLAALAFAVLGCWRFHGLAMYGPQFHISWRSAPSLSVIAEHVAFLGRYDVYAYDAPVWSLVHEMRISLVFPLLCLISLRLRSWFAFLLAFSFPIANRLIERYSGAYTGGGYPGVQAIFWADTVGFCGIFLLGSIVARYREPLIARLSGLSMWLVGAFSAVALGLYQYPGLFHVPHYLLDFATGLGAAYFVVLALKQDGWPSHMLRLEPVVWLGRVSYSLYLVHVPILFVLSILAFQKLPYGYLLVPFVLVSLCAAEAFHRWVEVPSIRAGRILASRIERNARPISTESSYRSTTIVS